MIDLSKLNLEGMQHWFKVARKYEAGKPITKNEILEMLESGCQIPTILNPMLAQIVRGEFPFAYPKRKPVPALFTPEFVQSLVRDMERYIQDPESRPDDFDSESHRIYDDLKRKDGYKNRKRITANDSAVKLAAQVLEMSERQVRDKITEYNKSLQQ